MNTTRTPSRRGASAPARARATTRRASRRSRSRRALPALRSLGGGGSHDDHVLEARQQRAIDRVKLTQQRVADHEDAGAAVPERVRVILRAPQRIERHGDDAGLDRAEEAVGERGSVLEDQRDALFGLNAETPERRAKSIDALGDLPVRDALIAAFDRDARAAAFSDVAIDEMGGGVEDVRQRGHAGILYQGGRVRYRYSTRYESFAASSSDAVPWNMIFPSWSTMNSTPRTFDASSFTTSTLPSVLTARCSAM